MNEPRDLLDGNLERDLRDQFLAIKKEHNLTVSKISQESGVARLTIDRIIEGKHDTRVRDTWGKIAKWRIEKGY